MSNVKLTFEQAAGLPRRVADQLRVAGERARMRAALRLLAHLRKLADSLGISDLGGYKRGFRVAGYSVTNDAPYSGVIEDGARPHPVSMEGQLLIAQWAMRKLGVDEKEAKQVAFLIARKISKVGQKARHVMRDSLPMAREFLSDELTATLKDVG